MTIKGLCRVKEFQNNNIDNDRIETMSIITESELEDFADDASSVHGILIKKKKGNKKTLNF
jgi:hypothetical protein